MRDFTRGRSCRLLRRYLRAGNCSLHYDLALHGSVDAPEKSASHRKSATFYSAATPSSTHLAIFVCSNTKSAKSHNLMKKCFERCWDIPVSIWKETGDMVGSQQGLLPASSRPRVSLKMNFQSSKLAVLGCN
jgi:hypothetical protein